MKLLLPRITAFRVLEDIINKKNTFERAFSANLVDYDLESRDRAFCYRLVSTTLRRLGQIDDLISFALERPLGKRGIGAQNILRLGICQLFFMDVKDYAAVNTSVDLAQNLKLGHYKKLINAVLRRLIKEGFRVIKKQDAEKLNTPSWLWKIWESYYGLKACYDIARFHQNSPPLDITVKRNPKLWAERLSGTHFFGNTVRLNQSQPVESLPGYADGEWWVQDLAASIPAKLFGDIENLSIVDLCAAPGGKTAQLISMGAKVVAVDKSVRRVEILAQNMKRLNYDPDIVVENACDWQPTYLFDGVLLDAPCSATGTLRRNPDINHIKTVEDMDVAIRLQKLLLRSAQNLVKRGGVIVFSTCSLLPQEGVGLIDSVLAEDKTLSRAPIFAEELGLMPDLVTEAGDLRTLPVHYSNLGGMDGFYATRLIRK
mgnify:CR=1 FL=1